MRVDRRRDAAPRLHERAPRIGQAVAMPDRGEGEPHVPHAGVAVSSAPGLRHPGGLPADRGEHMHQHHRRDGAGGHDRGQHHNLEAPCLQRGEPAEDGAHERPWERDKAGGLRLVDGGYEGGSDCMPRHIPRGLPRPNDPNHSAEVAAFAARAPQRLGGRTMVLTLSREESTSMSTRVETYVGGNCRYAGGSWATPCTGNQDSRRIFSKKDPPTYVTGVNIDVAGGYRL